MIAWQWLNDNAGALGIIFVAIPLAWAAWRYFVQKRREGRSERFNTYHSLIKQLVEPEDEGVPMRLDRQLAVVYELRRFPEYFEPSLRILEGLKENWSKNVSPNDPKKRLLMEMDDTRARITKKSRNIFRRIKRAIQNW